MLEDFIIRDSTSNHYGATADGLVLAYRAGAKLLYADTLQYHPTGAAYPEQIFGALVTEKYARLVPSLSTLTVKYLCILWKHVMFRLHQLSASSSREKGIHTASGVGVWLDTPMIELKNGEGTIESRIPAMLRMFGKYGIDIRREPILVYPTLHYQNGGIDISDNGESGVQNLSLPEKPLAVFTAEIVLWATRFLTL